FVTPAFMRAEYSLVVLSNRITTEAEYAKVRRPGRGVRMGRASRRAVWKVIGSYRGRAAADGSTDWRGNATSAAGHLNRRAARGVLPNRITTDGETATLRGPARGVRMGRASRRAVWKVIASYRALAAADGSTDWHEKAMIAAAYLNDRVARGVQRPADHVLVDEAQDLTPAHLKFLRALVPEGKNDLFLAEDAHQRIYGP